MIYGIRDMTKMKTIIMFKCNCLLKPETREQLRQELKKQLDEGVVVVDGRYDWPILTRLPEDCEYDVVVESLEENELGGKENGNNNSRN